MSCTCTQVHDWYYIGIRKRSTTFPAAAAALPAPGQGSGTLHGLRFDSALNRGTLETMSPEAERESDTLANPTGDTLANSTDA